MNILVLILYLAKSRVITSDQYQEYELDDDVITTQFQKVIDENEDKSLGFRMKVVTNEAQVEALDQDLAAADPTVEKDKPVSSSP